MNHLLAVPFVFLAFAQATRDTPNVLSVSVALAKRADLDGKPVFVKGTLHATMESVFLSGTGCKEEINSFGKRWPCAVDVFVFKEIQHPTSQRLQSLLRRMQPSGGKGGPEIVVRGTFRAAPKVKKKAGEPAYEVGWGHLNSYLVRLETEQIFECSPTGTCDLTK
jgi:hypothetical protein